MNNAAKYDIFIVEHERHNNLKSGIESSILAYFPCFCE